MFLILTVGQTMSPMASGNYRTASPRQSQQSAPRTQPGPVYSAMPGFFTPYNNSYTTFPEQDNAFAQLQALQQQMHRQRAPLIQQDRCATPDMVAGFSDGSTRSVHFSNQQFAPPPQTQAPIAPAQSAFAGAYGAPAQFSFEGTQTQNASNLQQFFPELDEPLQSLQQQMPPSQYQPQPGTPARSSPQLLSNENLGYHNLHTGAKPLGHMQGWLGRASAIGDRAMPRLDTGHLAPPALSDAHLSPSSASSAGSSAGRSPRRSKEDMVLGEISCSQCDAAFSTQGDLTHHLRSHQPYQSRNHVCPHCDKRFQYRKDLARHVPRHDPNRPRYYCRFPGCKFNTKGFGRQDHLDRHLATQHRMDSPMRISRTPSNRTS